LAAFVSKAKEVSESELTPGLTLFGNLCYTRSFNRTQFSPSDPTSNPGTRPLGAPRVTTMFFDGPVNVSCQELIDTGVSADKAYWMDQRGDATCRAFEDYDGTNVQIYLPNGRRTTAHGIEAGADDMARGESGFEVGRSPRNYLGLYDQGVEAFRGPAALLRLD